MRKLTLLGMVIIALLGACNTSNSPNTPATPAVTQTRADFSRFPLIRLTPTALPVAISKHTPSLKAAAHLDRELMLRLSKTLNRQKIVPTGADVSENMLNVIPVFVRAGESLILVVEFQDNATKAPLANRQFMISNSWADGFQNSVMDRALLASLAQQVVNMIQVSQ